MTTEEKEIMKLDKMAVIVSNTDGDVYQVLLDKKQSMALQHFLLSLHGGRINVAANKLESLQIIKPKENERTEKRF